jgi:hypothetical protein
MEGKINYNDLKEGAKFKCVFNGSTKHGVIDMIVVGNHKSTTPKLIIYDVYDGKEKNHTHYMYGAVINTDMEKYLSQSGITDFEILQELKFEDFKHLRCCSFVRNGEVVNATVVKATEGQHKAYLSSNKYNLTIFKYKGGRDIDFPITEQLAALDITDFKFLPDVPEMTIEKAVKQVTADTYLDKLQFTDFNKEPILCSLPKKYIVSLVFNNTKGVQNTVDVVSATCVHEALGAAIEKQMKTHQGLIVYEVVDNYLYGSN